MDKNKITVEGDIRSSGVISVGDGNEIHFSGSQIAEFNVLTEKAIEEIRSLENQSEEWKDEVIGQIKLISEEIKKEQPKTKIKLMLKGLLTSVDVVLKITALCPALEKLIEYIKKVGNI